MQFWISLDGYNCDEGPELYRPMNEISDDAQEQHFGTRPGEIVVHGDASPCSRSPQVRVCPFIYTAYRVS
jgi:hypothetical protein